MLQIELLGTVTLNELAAAYELKTPIDSISTLTTLFECIYEDIESEGMRLIYGENYVHGFKEEDYHDFMWYHNIFSNNIKRKDGK